MMGPLWDATRDLHHACEAHPLGQRMVEATIEAQDWCDWLNALRVLHSAIDPHLPPYAQVTGELTLDLVEMLPMVPQPVNAAQAFAGTLQTPERIGGAAYVLVGAHRRGGRVTEKRFREAGRKLPMRHVRFFAPDPAEALVKSLRDMGQLASAASATFQCLLDVMDEIVARGDFATAPTVPDAKLKTQP
ncbi:MAG: hypothetical protein ACNA7M_08250 [Roseovarius sp.]